MAKLLKETSPQHILLPPLIPTLTWNAPPFSETSDFLFSLPYAFAHSGVPHPARPAPMAHNNNRELTCHVLSHTHALHTPVCTAWVLSIDEWWFALKFAVARLNMGQNSSPRTKIASFSPGTLHRNFDQKQRQKQPFQRANSKTRRFKERVGMGARILTQLALPECKTGLSTVVVL